jgi:outer membrane protein
MNRVELKKQENQQSYYQNNYQYSKYELLPSVNSRMDFNFTEKKSYDQNEGGYRFKNNENGQWNISANLVLFNGFQTINKIKQSKTLIARNNTYTQSIKNNIKLEVIQAYYSLLMAQENIIITKQAIEVTNQQIAYIQIAVDGGKTSEIDLLEVKAQLEKEKSYYISSIKELEISQIKLKKSINYTDTNSFEIRSVFLENLVSKSLNTDSIYFLAINQLPEFKMATYDSLYWQYAIKQIKAQYMPYLTGNASVATSYNRRAIDFSDINSTYRANNQLENNLNNNIGLSLIIPIYSKHKTKIQQLEKEKQLQEVNLDEEQLYIDIYFEIEQLCKETQRQQEKIKTIEKRLEYYTTIYSMRAEQYKQGVLSINDLLIADTNKKKTELNLSYEKYTLLYKLKIIDFYSGKI